MTDLRRYAAVERQKIGEGEWRYVRLHEEPMPARDVLAWLLAEGYVKRVPTDDPDGDGFAYVGWGTSYFAVPWEKSVER